MIPWYYVPIAAICGAVFVLLWQRHESRLPIADDEPLVRRTITGCGAAQMEREGLQ